MASTSAVDCSVVHPLPGLKKRLDYDPSEDENCPSCIGKPLPSLLREQDIESDGPATLPLTTLREFSMLQFMNAVTDKVDWHIKVFDDDIAAKWQQEMVDAAIAAFIKERDAQDEDEGLPSQWPIHTVPRNESLMTEEMATACIAELRHRAQSFANSPNGAVFVYNGDVFKSDSAVPEEARLALEEHVRPLEDVPDKLKDWHPGSDGKVLDLVHPSLFPLIYGRTKVLPVGAKVTSLQAQDCVKRCGEGVAIRPPKRPKTYGFGEPEEAYSTKFQWLPCEVDISGEKARILSYINNLHPEVHPELYSIIEDIITAAIPLWEQTLAGLVDEDYRNNRMSRTYYFDPEYDPDPEDFDDECGPQISDLDLQDEPREYWDDYLHEAREAWIEETRRLVLPEAWEFNPDDCVAPSPFSLKQHKPEYEGGTWHVEGKLNEHIVATALYYYSSANITTSSLAFRQLSEHGHEVSGLREGLKDYNWIAPVYGTGNYDSAIQDVGSVETRQGRLLTFPNILQHRVEPFSLEDKTKPGHRKILALFLVDPNVRVISTAHVPAQRMDWWIQDLEQSDARTSLLGDLPNELKECIYGEVDGFPISLEEAGKAREDLMEERKAFVMKHEYTLNRATISLCEH
ncbi:hypothetical protein BKA70DRAFT_1326180 [Coprinopsis sp. MPI-PUGE-AT-0042]|nr:hypothetical protein BKA70DRAFT_1326180 [Coprinopsis sp. MPI-PUGE-AT-0042]